MMWAFRPRPHWQHRRGRQGRDCLESVRLNFAPRDVISCVMLLAKPGPPEGWAGPVGLGSRDYLGAKPELPEGLRVLRKVRRKNKKITLSIEKH